MNVKLYTKFVKNIVSKVISKLVAKKIGYDIGIQINNFELSEIDGEMKIVANVEANMKTEDFLKIVGFIEED